MRVWPRSRDEPADADERRWVGPALVEAATEVATMDDLDARLVAFEVALAVGEGEDQGLDALSSLVRSVAGAPAVDDIVLTNALTALQYGTLRADHWTPPTAETARLVGLALAGGVLLHDQAERLLGAILDAHVGDRWLGGAREGLATRVASTGLRAELQQPAS